MREKKLAMMEGATCALSEWVGGWRSTARCGAEREKNDHTKIDSESVWVVVVELGKTQCPKNKINDILLKNVISSSSSDDSNSNT